MLFVSQDCHKSMLKSDKCIQGEVVKVYANDTVLRGACLTILAKNQMFLNKIKWDKIKKLNSKGSNEHGL